MQHPKDKSQAIHDGWANGEDSPVMTIEYLRARLLAERSISKAAKERADELSKRVKELEEQLKSVSLQRKRAEKATLDVLSYLESHGVSDVSELYESDSDHEDSFCDTNMGKSNEDQNFSSLETHGNGKESSSSDHESAPSSTGSLCWKGRKKITQALEKKYFDSLTQRQTSSPMINSSLRRRHGKSCRQIKGREMRSVAEAPSHDSLKYDVHDSITLDSSDTHSNCLDAGSDILNQSPDKRVERGLRRNEVSHSSQDQTQAGDASSSNRGHERSGEMERALIHQAQLIGLYEAQEKAQRDWEDKYGDNHVSMQDSCEPENHSDVTEERDENRTGTPHHGDDIPSHNGNGQMEGSETNFQSKQSPITHFNSFKLSPHVDTGVTGNHSLSETPSPRSAALDFAFPTVNNEASVVPHEEPHRQDGILNALQAAKLILKQQLGSFSKSNESTKKDDVEWLNIPVACPGLFRVPTDLPSQSPNNSPQFSDSYGYGRIGYLQGRQNVSSPMDSRLTNSDLASSSKSGFLPYSSYHPDYLASPNRLLSSQLPRSEVGIPTSGSPSLYNHDVRHDMMFR